MELILLRPLWLLALLPWLWQGWRRNHQAALLAPAMAAYLLPRQGRSRPWLWLACLPLILALAGPALRQQSQPVTQPATDIWLLDLSDSMLAQDLAPDRATRVRLMLQEMLAQSGQHPVALILYAADAYLAMPPSRDHDAIALLLPDLRPSIMPLQGSAPERAVALALAQIPAGQQARLLLITDGLSPRQMDHIAAQWPCQGSLFCHDSASPRLDILLANGGQATPLPPASEPGLNLRLGRVLPPPDVDAMTRLASQLGGSLQWLQAGTPRFTPLPMTQTPSEGQSRDLGPWLLIPLLPLALLARVGSAWLLLLGLGLGLTSPPSLYAKPALPAASPPLSMQEGEAWQAYQHGDYLTAARTFEDAIWQGNAWYRAGDYERAAKAYGRASSATAHYNRGNALVQLGNLSGAEQAYLAALALDPRNEDAIHNLALLRPQSSQAASRSQAGTPEQTREQDATPERPRPPAPPVILLEQRLRKEAQRRPLLKVEEPW
ncbi:vWA domain-containing protein [Aeromonas sp. NJAU223]|uniref:vWA domain-containing protein n=1 Tax=Aeromonas sp. NJAU223 TaxID=3115650 RepID=UPI003DA7D687